MPAKAVLAVLVVARHRGAGRPGVHAAGEREGERGPQPKEAPPSHERRPGGGALARGLPGVGVGLVREGIDRLAHAPLPPLARSASAASKPEVTAPSIDTSEVAFRTQSPAR